MTVDGGKYTAKGKKSAICYSTGDITVTGIAGSSALGPMCVVEGSNKITVKDSELTSGGESRGILLHQSGSGDASGHEGSVSVTGGKLIYTVSDKPLIEVTTSMTGTVTLTDVDLEIKSGILTVGDGVTWNGAYDKADSGKSTSVIIKGTWILTDDSNVDKVTVEKGGVISQNGHKLSYSVLSGEGKLQ